MAAATGFTTTRHKKLYHDDEYLASPDLTTVKALAVAANFIEHARIPGNVEQTGNTIEFPELGKATRTQVADAATLAPFTFSVSLDLADAKHASLLAATPGDPMVIVYEIKTGASAATYFYLRGTVGSISGPESADGDVTTATFTLNQDQAAQKFDESG